MSPRTRVMLGAMVGSGLLGAADTYWRSGQPKPAAAATVATPGATTLTVPSEPVEPLLGQLRAKPSPADLRLGSLRNVFALSDGMRAALEAMKPAPTVEPGGADAAEAPTSAPVFPVVRAILAGAQPLALLDERLVSVGARLDDQYRVVRIERDRVVLSDGSAEVNLPLRVPWIGP